jgi:hypothetical protein
MEAVISERWNSTVNGKASKSKRAASPRTGSGARHLRHVERWGSRYVLLACDLSSGLNCWANVDLCGSDSVLGQVSAGGLGAVVPVLVWLLGKIAGHAYRAGRRQVCWAVGTAGVALLALSVWHCAHAIALLTGGGLVLAGLMAVGIDYGLIASEVAAIVCHDE